MNNRILTFGITVTQNESIRENKLKLKRSMVLLDTLLIEMNSGYGILIVESSTCFGNFIKSIRLILIYFIR